MSEDESNESSGRNLTRQELGASLACPNINGSHVLTGRVSHHLQRATFAISH